MPDPRLTPLLDLMAADIAAAILAERLEDAREILNEDGDVPPEYNAEAEPPKEDDE